MDNNTENITNITDFFVAYVCNRTVPKHTSSDCGSILRLSLVGSAQTSETKWTLGVKRAQAQYKLPSVSAP